jgi:hypothetical protein
MPSTGSSIAALLHERVAALLTPFSIVLLCAVQWRSSVVARPGRGPPSSAQNTKEPAKKLAQERKKLLDSLGWPAQLFG